jgi:PKD repeat protein
VLGYAAAGGGAPPPTCSAPVATFNVIADSTLTVFADPTGSTPNSGVCSISGYNWTWGDGSNEAGSATGNSHPYANAGTYTIQLEATNQAGSGFFTRTVTVPVPSGPPPCAKPTANFSWTQGGQGNKTYTYTDRSSVADPINCPITDWLWTFSDINPPATGQQSNAQNPAPVTYGNGSSHSVTLRVTDAGGSTTVTRSG